MLTTGKAGPTTDEIYRKAAPHNRAMRPLDLVCLSYELAQPVPANPREPREAVRGVGIVAVVDDERTTLHQRVGDEPPVSAVTRVVAIVTEHEITLPWDDQWSPVVSRRIVRNARVRWLHDVVALPAKTFFDTIQVGAVRRIALRQPVRIPEEHAALHLQRVAGKSDE